MSFRYNATGVQTDRGNFELIPPGWYSFKIFGADEMVSKKSGYPMVVAKCQVTGDSPVPDATVYHYIVFIPAGKKGAGINVHFRKSIGVPYEGDLVVDADSWIGKRFMGRIEHEEYEGKRKHKIAEVAPIDGTPKDDTDIPF